MNCSLNEVSSKLFFHLARPDEKVLYSETTPTGTMGVSENLDGETTSVSLELLFNAATQYPAEIERLFNRKYTWNQSGWTNRGLHIIYIH